MSKPGNEISTSTDRPEVTIHLGNQSRLLRFGAQQTAVFEEMLGKDPLSYIAAAGGPTKFCADAIMAGLSYDRATRKEMTPTTVYRWLDDAKDLDREEFQKAVLYAIARGKTGAEAVRWVKVLDEVFNDTPAGAVGPTPGG